MLFHKDILWLAFAAVFLGTGSANKSRVKRQGPKIWRVGYGGHGTTHEKMGLRHWTMAEFTQYVSVANYSKTPGNFTGNIGPVYRIGEHFLQGMFNSDPPIPVGYVRKVNGSTMLLGHKVEQDNWSDLLSQYATVVLWVGVILIIIIITPFLGVCYCCFCCCYRCKQGCPPCEQGRDARRRFICGACLILFIPPIIVGIVIVFLSNRTLDIGLADTKATVRMGSEDTCTYLKDVADHIYHLFIYNYQEMETHLLHHLKNAHKHIFMDLSDTSEANSMEELERVIRNMPEALRLMEKVYKLELDIRFLAAQLRDGLRGVKKETNQAMALNCRTSECINFLRKNDIEYLDASDCLHLEGLPDTSVYVRSLERIVKSKLLPIAKRGLARLKIVQQKIKRGLDRVNPPVYRDISAAKALFEAQARYVMDAINSVISEVQLATLRSTKSFDDVYERFSETRSAINMLVCLLIISIITLLILALLCGCLGRTATGTGDRLYSKVTGSWFLCVAIVMIFCVLSFVFLVGLFYFMLGAVMYMGACAPLRNLENRTIFGYSEPSVDLTKMLPHDEGTSLPPLSLVSAVEACRGNQAIFNYLKVHEIYDVDDLIRVQVISYDGPRQKPVENEDLSQVVILDNKELGKMNNLNKETLKDYHSSRFTNILCNQYTPINLKKLAENYVELADSLATYAYAETIIVLKNQNRHLRAYTDHFHAPLQSKYHEINRLLLIIDDLILYENYDFGTTMHKLLGAISRSQNFIRRHGGDYIGTLAKNLSDVVVEQSEIYVDYLIAQCNQEVGPCRPLSYIYDRSLDLVCNRLVDPINGYWIGVLLCAFLLIPVLFLSHILMCLYTKIKLVPFVPILGYGCPICTGDPYVPPPLLICHGGEQADCECMRVSGAGTKVFDLAGEMETETDAVSVRSSSLMVTSPVGLKNKED